MKRILCYGDSNTWGYIPGSGMRLPAGVRWTGVAAKQLGSAFTIIESGLNGRTTVFDDPYTGFRNGKKGLGYVLVSQKPLDLIILSLGTNDLKYTGAVGSRKGLEELLRMIHHADSCFGSATGSPIFPSVPRILVISPIQLHPDIAALRPESELHDRYAESLRFAPHFAQAAAAWNASFLDAAQIAVPSAVDGIHMDAASHAALGAAVANKVREIFCDDCANTETVSREDPG